jgi:hypothetical protein
MPTAAFSVPASAPASTPVAFDASASTGTGTLRYAWTLTGPDGFTASGTGRVLWRTFPAAGMYQVTLTVSDDLGAAILTQPYTAAAPALRREELGISHRLVTPSGSGLATHTTWWARATSSRTVAIGDVPAGFGAQLKGWVEEPGTAVGFELADGTRILAGLTAGGQWTERIVSATGSVLHQATQTLYARRAYLVIEHDGTQLTARFQDGNEAARVVTMAHAHPGGALAAVVVPLSGSAVRGSLADIITWEQDPITVRGLRPGQAAEADDALAFPDSGGRADIARGYPRPFAERVAVIEGGADVASFERAYPERIADIPVAPEAPVVSVVGITETTVALIAGPYDDVDGTWTHESTQWQVRTSGGSVVADSGYVAGAGLFAQMLAGLPDGTSLKARARFRDDSGAVSAWSDEVAFSTPQANRAPGQPTISATIVNPAVVHLLSSSYDDPDAGDTHAASQWQVSLGSDSGFSSPILDQTYNAASGGLLSATVYNLTPGQSYRGRVRHQDGGGLWSAWSAAATWTMPTVTPPPGTPTATIEAVAQNSITAGFTAGSGGTVEEVRYQLATSSDTGFDSPLSDSGWTSGTHAFSSLTPATQYRVRVRARNAGGESAWSAGVTATTEAEGDPPDAPAVVFNRRGTTTISVQAQLAATGAVATQVRYQITTGGDVEFAAPVASSGWVGPAGTFLHQFSGLTENTAYRIRAQAGNEHGESEWSEALAVTTLAAGVAEAPILYVDRRGRTTADLPIIFQGNTAHNGTRWQIALPDDPDFLFPVRDTGMLTLSAQRLSYTATGLTAGQVYIARARVRATTSDATLSDWSEVIGWQQVPNLSGEVARYSADVPGSFVLDTSGGVVAWYDEYGWAPALKGSSTNAAARPIFSGDGVAFDGVDDFLDTSTYEDFWNLLTGTSTGAFFLVVMTELTVVTGSGPMQLFNSSGSGPYLRTRRLAAGMSAESSTGTGSFGPTGIPLPRDGTRRAFWGWRRSGSTTPKVMHGSPGWADVPYTGTDSPNTGSATRLRLDTGTSAWLGSVHAVIIWNRIPSASELAGLLADAAGRYGAATSQ